MTTQSGISPLDERLDGLRSGGLYLMAGAPGSGRLVALMQFLEAGLSAGKVGLVTAAPPARIFEESNYWGFGLESAWQDGRLRLLTLGDDFERRLTSSADPSEVYEEMGDLLGPDVHRVALYPGTPLWDARSGTAFATRFLKWIEQSGATVFASTGGTLDGVASPATEWVLQSASGIFHLEVLPDGLRQITLQRVTPAPQDDSPITVDLVPSEGFVAAAEKPRRRRADMSREARRNLLILNFCTEVPLEVRTWATKHYLVEEVDEPFRAVELVQESPDRYGIVLIHLDRGTVDAALRACRLVRRLSGVPILMLTEDPVRASDRLNGLQAGANDFMSGPISVLEIASRIDQAVIAGGRPAADDVATPDETEGADRVLSRARFAEEVDRRLAQEDRAPFTFVRIPARDGSDGDSAMRNALLATIRVDQGDRVGELHDGIGVILHGSPLKQVPAFVNRVESALGSEGSAFEWEALSSAADPEQIRAEVDRPSRAERLTALKTAS